MLDSVARHTAEEQRHAASVSRHTSPNRARAALWALGSPSPRRGIRRKTLPGAMAPPAKTMDYLQSVAAARARCDAVLASKAVDEPQPTNVEKTKNALSDAPSAASVRAVFPRDAKGESERRATGQRRTTAVSGRVPRPAGRRQGRSCRRGFVWKALRRGACIGAAQHVRRSRYCSRRGPGGARGRRRRGGRVCRRHQNC